MKIVSFHEFLTMPEGTVFCGYDPVGNFGGLCIKENTITTEHGPVDFVYRPLTSDLGGYGSDEERDLLEQTQRGEPVPIVFDSSWREALYGDQAFYAVWDTADVKGLIAALSDTVEEDK